ncbi:MAG: HVA1 family protein [Paracoccaceae bacterium]
MNKFTVGDEVEWSWGDSTGTGKVVECFTRKVTRTIKGN